MWKKIEIINIDIENYENNGFMLNIGKNTISNTEKTINIKLPFKIQNINNLYNFELFFNNNKLKMFIYINLVELENIVINKTLIPYKNNLFSIFKSVSKNFKKSRMVFKGINTLNRLIDKVEITNNLNENIMRIGNLKFDLESERIDIFSYFDKNLTTVDLYFFLTKNIDFIKYENIVSKFKICIIDDGINHNKEIVINRQNSSKICSKFINENRFIVIDKRFFMSNNYTKYYKNFHTNHTGYYAYSNYKRYIENQDENQKTYNVELFDGFVFIFRNIDISEISNHPFLYSNSRKIFIIDSFSDEIIHNYNKFAYNYAIKKYGKENDVLYNKNSYYMETPIYNIYGRLRIDDRIELNSFDFNIPTTFHIMYFPVDEFCYINYRQIGLDCNVLFDCNHRFISTNIDIFFKSLDTCPYCENKIKQIKVYVNPSNIIKDLFGKEFQSIFTEFPLYDHLLLKEYPDSFKHCVNQIYKNIVFIDTIEKLNHDKPYILYTSLGKTYDILNHTNENIVKTYKIID